MNTLSCNQMLDILTLGARQLKWTSDRLIVERKSHPDE